MPSSRYFKELLDILHEDEQKELGELLLENCPQFTNSLKTKFMSKKVIAKDIYKSRTVWLGVLGVLAGAAWLFTGEPEFKEFLLIIMGSLGIYLRTETTQPIKKK